MLYFDQAATSLPSEEALYIYEYIYKGFFANPSSNHNLGRKAFRLLEDFRHKILFLLGLDKTHNCIFLSGATEANNLAIKGIAFNYQNRGKKIISCKVEHPSVLNSLNQLKDTFGFDINYLKVDNFAKPSLEDLETKIDSSTILVCLMGVNNEVGSILDIDKVSNIVSKYPKCYLHVDAAQCIGKLNLDYSKADLISFSSHKFGGPKGVGALLYRKGISFLPLHSGGHQEYGYRAGTIDLPSIAAMSKALEISLANLEDNLKKEEELATHLKKGLSTIEEVIINSPSDGSPYVINFSLTKHKASVVVEALSEKEIYVSSISACSSKKEETSYVLLEAGLSNRLASNSIRVSMPSSTSFKDVDKFIKILKETLNEVKPL